MADQSEVMTWEEFKKELDNLAKWIGKSPRSHQAWLYSVERWAQGDR